MSLPSILKDGLALPVVASPLFIISNPDLVIAQCKAGIVGSFPALNARPAHVLEEWLLHITSELENWNKENPKAPAAPFAINQVVHNSNERLGFDMDLCVKYKVPIVITSLGARTEIFNAIHSYGGICLHDVINIKFARKAIEKGADGLIAVSAGAGGHAGIISPFAFVQEIREWFDGPLLLAGCIANGGAILAAQAAGADMAYIGSPFIATSEANADQRNKQAIVDATSDDIVYTNMFTGIHANFLKAGIIESGLDPDNLPLDQKGSMAWSSGGSSKAKVWKDIWACGQGIGIIKEVTPAAQLVERLKREYADARCRLSL